MSKCVFVSTLLVVAMMIALPSLAHNQIGSGAVHHNHHVRPDEATKEHLMKKIHAAVKQHQHRRHHNGNNDMLATPVGTDAIVADATAHIGSSLFTKITTLISEAVNTYGSSVVIPGMSEKHFSFSSVHFTTFNVGSIEVDFIAPNKIRFAINDLNIVIPSTEFHVFTKILFAKLSCHGYFKGTVTGTSLAIDLTLDTNAATQKIGVIAATSTVSFGRLDISHKMEDVLCKVSQSIIQLFLGSIDKLIDKFIKEKLPADVGPIVEKLLNNVFGKLPITVTGNPVINSEGISVNIDIAHYPKTDSSVASAQAVVATTNNNLFRVAKPAKGSLQQLINAPVLPIVAAVGDNSRDLNVIITQANLDKVLQIEQLEGKINAAVLSEKITTSIFKLLIPTAYIHCPDCRLFFTITAPVSPPSANLNNNTIALSADDIFISVAGVNSSSMVDPPSPDTLVSLFTLTLNGTVALEDLHTTGDKNSTIKFKLGVPEFNLALHGSSVGPIPLIPTVNSLLRNLILDVVVPAFNGAFPGIPFPAFLIHDIVALVANNQFDLGFNVL